MNKKIIVLIIAIIILALIGGIIFMINSNKNNEQNPNNTNQQANSNMNNKIQNAEPNARIKLTANGNQEMYVNLDNNQASNDFLEMLPLTLTFEDYNNTEKIATLPYSLGVEGLPSGYTPEIGDFSYYAPWGNISIFYKEFRYSNSLYKLGTIESGTEIFNNINEDFTVTIERVN